MALETATVVTVLTTLVAALITGFFGLITLIGGKESRVSEFRQSWIDGLRNDISTFAAATHELALIEPLENAAGVTALQYAALSSQTYVRARESLTKIALRLNPKHAKKPRTIEGNVWGAVTKIRSLFNDKKYNEVIEALDELRDTSSLLLKKEWGRVKRGEWLFVALKAVAALAVTVAALGLWLVYENASVIIGLVC